MVSRHDEGFRLKPHWSSHDGRHALYCGDVLEVLASLPGDSAHCCITSPPYWGLRSYLSKDHEHKRLEIGSEPTPAAFVQTMVEVFRAVRRVLHPSGTVWLNLGDSYAQSEIRNRNGENPEFYRPCRDGVAQTGTKLNHGLKPKNLCLIPWRVAIALQADGWWIRSIICWAKKSPMPESAADRPTNSWEPIFLMSKRASYFYDNEAVKEPSGTEPHARGGVWTPAQTDGPMNRNGKSQYDAAEQSREWGNGTRNQRNVWHLGPEPYSEAHFATFPTAIPRRAILAGTSARGCCPKCLEPWERVVEKSGGPPKGDHRKRDDFAETKYNAGAHRAGVVTGGALSSVYAKYGYPETRTIGWAPGCKCGVADTIPCTVLDPFVGSGTTMLVAAELVQRSIGIELNPDYCDLAVKRIQAEAAQAQLPLVAM